VGRDFRSSLGQPAANSRVHYGQLWGKNRVLRALCFFGLTSSKDRHKLSGKSSPVLDSLDGEKDFSCLILPVVH